VEGGRSGQPVRVPADRGCPPGDELLLSCRGVAAYDGLMFSRTAVVAGTLSALTILYAQTPPSADPPPVIEPLKTTITVTGTRTATELDRTPVSTSLITRDELDTRGVNQVDQVLSGTEGVSAYRTKGPADNDFGVGMRGFSGRGGQSRTLILLDGQPLNDSYTGAVNWSMLPVSEFERVEVVRGPFSSLYGGNAMGGVINLITRPVERRHLELSGQFGAHRTTAYSLHATDRFFNRLGLSFGYRRRMESCSDSAGCAACRRSNSGAHR
jgi:outer membrane receptor protein involved in Fe transport